MGTNYHPRFRLFAYTHRMLARGQDSMRFWLVAVRWRSFCLRTFTAVLTVALLLPRLATAEPRHRAILVLDQSSAGLPFNAAVASAIKSTINAGSNTPV